MTANETAAAGSAAACDGLIRAKSACLGPEGQAGRHQASRRAIDELDVNNNLLIVNNLACVIALDADSSWLASHGHRSTPGTGRRHADAEIPVLITDYCDKGGSVAERSVPELISVLGSQPAGDVSHKPGGRLPLLSARPAVTLATLKRAATNSAAW